MRAVQLEPDEANPELALVASHRRPGSIAYADADLRLHGAGG